MNEVVHSSYNATANYSEWVKALGRKLKYADRVAKEVEQELLVIQDSFLEAGLALPIQTIQRKLMLLHKRLRRA